MTIPRATRSRARIASAWAARDVVGRPHARALAGTAGLNVTTVLVSSIGGLILARALGPTQRGDLVTIISWPAVLGTIASVGLTQSTCYWVAKRPERASAFMSTAVAAALATGAVLAVLGPWIGALIGRNAAVSHDLALLLAFSPVYIAGGVWASALQAKSIAGWNVARAIQPIFYFVANLSLWLFGWLTLESAVLAFVLSLLLQGIWSLVAAHRIVGHHVRPEPALLGPIYAYGAKVWLAAVPQIVNVRLDLLVLSVMSTISAAQLGVYAVAVSLSWLALPAASAFGSVAFPRIAGATSEVGARRVERLSLVGAGVVAAATISLICVLAPILVPVLFGEGYRDAVAVLWLLAPGTVFLALNLVLGDVLQGQGKPLVRSAGEGLGAVTTLVLLLLLIPPYGIRGAAIASSITYCAVFVFLLWGSHRQQSSSPTDTARV